MMIALEARVPALNRIRSWTLAADQDLFGGRYRFRPRHSSPPTDLCRGRIGGDSPEVLIFFG
jgi:hypothetical protein